MGIPYGSTPATCPVRALKDWLAVLKAGKGPVFRTINQHDRIFDQRLSSKAVALVVRRLTVKHAIQGDFAGHSLRAGLARAAASAGVPERAIMQQTGRKSLATSASTSAKAALFLENAAGRVGL